MPHQHPALFLYRAKIAAVLAAALFTGPEYENLLAANDSIEKWKSLLHQLIIHLQHIGVGHVLLPNECILAAACIAIVEFLEDIIPGFANAAVHTNYPQYQVLLHAYFSPALEQPQQHALMLHALRHGMTRTFGTCLPFVPWPWTLSRLSALDSVGAIVYLRFVKFSLEGRISALRTGFAADPTLRDAEMQRLPFVCSFIYNAVLELRAALDNALPNPEDLLWTPADSDSDDDENDEAPVENESSEDDSPSYDDSSHRSMSSEDVPGKCKICDTRYTPDSSEDDGCCSACYENQSRSSHSNSDEDS